VLELRTWLDSAMLNTQKVPAELRRALHKRDLFSQSFVIDDGSKTRIDDHKRLGGYPWGVSGQ
jgi:hypothetical protein